MAMYYRTEPMPHQKQFVEWAINKPRIGLYDEPGSGKTKMALDIIQNRNLDQVYVFLPIRLKQTWLNEMETHYAGTIPINFVGYEHLSVRKTMPSNITKNTLLIFDESHLIKNPRSKRGKVLRKFFSEQEPQVITMTGTPKPQDNRDLYMQAGILDLPAGRMKMTLFEQTYVEMVKGRFAMVCLRDINTEHLMEQFAKVAVFRKKKDMLNLPDKIYNPMYYEPNSKVIEVLKDLNRESLYLFENAETVQEQIIIAKKHVMNCIRLCSGYLTTENEWKEKQLTEIIPFNENPKLKLLLTLLETLGPNEKVIVLTCFSYEAEQIAKVLREAKLGMVLLHHGQNKMENLEKTFNLGDARVLVATIQSVDVGITLIGANRIVYYNNTYHTVQRIQSEDRIHRKGQNKNCIYYDLMAKGFPDEKVRMKLKNNTDNAEALFDLYKSLT